MVNTNFKPIPNWLAKYFRSVLEVDFPIITDLHDRDVEDIDLFINNNVKMETDELGLQHVYL